MRGEELHVLGNVRLRDHVLHRGLRGLGGDGVDATKGEPEETITGVLLKLRGEGLGKLDGLALDSQATDDNVVGTDGARGRRVVAVGDLPGGPSGCFECAGLFRVEEGVAFGGGFHAGREFGGPNL